MAFAHPLHVPCAPCRASRALAFFIIQCRRHSLPITFSIENPESSLLFSLPFIVSTKLEVITVDYCCYGGSCQKPTSIALSSPLADLAESGWAVRCAYDGSCGAMSVTSRHPFRLGHGAEASYGAEHSRIPDLLCSLLCDSWVKHHAPLRLSQPDYCTVAYDSARALSGEWVAAQRLGFN